MTASTTIKSNTTGHGRFLPPNPLQIQKKPPILKCWAAFSIFGARLFARAVQVIVSTEKLRQKIYRQLDYAPARGQAMSWPNKVISATIVLSVIVTVLATERSLAESYALFFNIVEYIVIFVFVSEYVLRLWTASLSPQYAGRGGMIKYVLSPMALIDLFAILPFFLPHLASETVMLRLLRLLRLLSLAKFGRYSAALGRIFDILHKKRFELCASMLIAFVAMFFAATGLYLAEGRVQPEAFGSIPRAMWWAVATLTTVGYGDVFPITAFGRVLGALAALAGIGLIALPTGVLAGAFNEALSKTEKGREAS